MASLKVEVAYAEECRQEIVSLVVEEGTSAIDAARASGLMRGSSFDSQNHLVLGIFGRVVPNLTVLHDGDRVEIYRTLNIDPKDARRLKAGRVPRRKPYVPG